jgi:TrmH family RNA methyltransferase
VNGLEFKILFALMIQSMCIPKGNPSSMGSFCRVKVHYTGLSDWLKQLSPRIAVYGTTLIGEPLHEVAPKKPSVIVFGNESHGISKEIQDIINHQITIPASPLSKTESLNAAMASSIILWHFFSCR